MKTTASWRCNQFACLIDVNRHAATQFNGRSCQWRHKPVPTTMLATATTDPNSMSLKMGCTGSHAPCAASRFESPLYSDAEAASETRVFSFRRCAGWLVRRTTHMCCVIVLGASVAAGMGSILAATVWSAV